MTRYQMLLLSVGALIAALILAILRGHHAHRPGAVDGLFHPDRGVFVSIAPNTPDWFVVKLLVA